LCADELILLDLSSSKKREKSFINWKLIENLASECFMPLSYGGGISTTADAKRLISIGIEKIIINSSLSENINLLRQVSSAIGSSSTIVSLDVRKKLLSYQLYSNSGTKRIDTNIKQWISLCEQNGAGEFFINNIDREGTWKGVDLNLIETVLEYSNVPVIYSGGSDSWLEAFSTIDNYEISAVGVGNLVCFQKRNFGVLINYPKEITDSYSV
jgi:cyclase